MYNIVFLAPSLKLGSGGCKVIYRLCQYLKKLGVNVSLYVNKLHSYPPLNWLDQEKKGRLCKCMVSRDRRNRI